MNETTALANRLAEQEIELARLRYFAEWVLQLDPTNNSPLRFVSEHGHGMHAVPVFLTDLKTKAQYALRKD